MRRIAVVSLVTVAFVLTLPAPNVDAVCEPPPPVGSSAGIRTMRAASLIVWGTIEEAPPSDAHGQHAFFLRVRGYFRGSGPARIEVSDHGDGDLPAEALRPGASLPATRAFLDRFAGQDAVVFARRDTAPYEGQYVTNICTYTTYGDAESSDILPVLRRTFGAPQPPSLAASGWAAGTLSAAAATLIAAGVALRAGARRRST